MTFYAWLKALHLVCAVLWVGGLFFAYVVLRPSTAAIDARQRMLLETMIFKRFFLLVWHAMPLIIITGFTMMALNWGVTNASWQLNAMMGLGLLMASLFLVIFFGPYRQFRRTTDLNRMVSRLDAIRKLVGVNLVLGLLTVVVAGLL